MFTFPPYYDAWLIAGRILYYILVVALSLVVISLGLRQYDRLSGLRRVLTPISYTLAIVAGVAFAGVFLYTQQVPLKTVVFAANPSGQSAELVVNGRVHVLAPRARTCVATRSAPDGLVQVTGRIGEREIFSSGLEDGVWLANMADALTARPGSPLLRYPEAGLHRLAETTGEAADISWP